MRIKPFDSKHLSNFYYDGLESPFSSFEEARANIKEYAYKGDAWVSVKDNGDVLAFAGIFELFPGVGYAWAYFNRGGYVHMKKYMTKMRSVIKGSGYRRVQAICIDTKIARRFLKAIGFVEEGVMRDFLPNGNMVMYSIIKGEI